MLYLFKVSKLRKALLVCGTIQLAIGTIGSLGVTYDKMIKCATLVTLSPQTHLTDYISSVVMFSFYVPIMSHLPLATMRPSSPFMPTQSWPLWCVAY